MFVVRARRSAPVRTITSEMASPVKSKSCQSAAVSRTMGGATWTPDVLTCTLKVGGVLKVHGLMVRMMMVVVLTV